MNRRLYREHLYRLQSHPDSVRRTHFVDHRDSLVRVYLSMIPFAILEYWIESTLTLVPSGLVFPMGYLLFWGFYYTFYEPGLLEDNLKMPRRLHLMAVPALLVRVAIWFVMVTLRGIFMFATPFSRREVRKAISKEVSVRHTVEIRTLPPEVKSALFALGLDERAGWDEIHHRYRELAKKFHPDLNPDITETGRRFMRFDTAYRRLLFVRNRYF